MHTIVHKDVFHGAVTELNGYTTKEITLKENSEILGVIHNGNRLVALVRSDKEETDEGTITVGFCLEGQDFPGTAIYIGSDSPPNNQHVFHVFQHIEEKEYATDIKAHWPR